jgi:hypothetical protein
VLRLTGEEPAAAGRRDAWLTADDAVLRRIARAGAAGIADFLSAPIPAPSPAPEPRPSGVQTVALAPDR